MTNGLLLDGFEVFLRGAADTGEDEMEFIRLAPEKNRCHPKFRAGLDQHAEEELALAGFLLGRAGFKS